MKRIEIQLPANLAKSVELCAHIDGSTAEEFALGAITRAASATLTSNAGFDSQGDLESWLTEPAGA